MKRIERRERIEKKEKIDFIHSSLFFFFFWFGLVLVWFGLFIFCFVERRTYEIRVS